VIGVHLKLTQALSEREQAILRYFCKSGSLRIIRESTARPLLFALSMILPAMTALGNCSCATQDDSTRMVRNWRHSIQAVMFQTRKITANAA
jgi:hypothetical protein